MAMHHWFIVPAFLACTSLASAEEWYTENLYPDWGETFRVTERLHKETTPFQELEILENPLFGRFLVLDGAIQATEADEFIYHEMLVHVPLLAHGHAANVLLIGGGDGGALREVLRHKEVERAVLVEIDAAVIANCKKYLPQISKGSFEHPKACVRVEDGLQFIQNSDERFDVILCDCTDPKGPATQLFSKEFYEGCLRVLKSDGILVMQNGAPFLQTEEFVNEFLHRAPLFRDNRFYLASIPSYSGGPLAFGWATNNPAYFRVSQKTLRERARDLIQGPLRYYTPSLHKAAFCLPKNLQRLLPHYGERMKAQPQKIKHVPTSLQKS